MYGLLCEPCSCVCLCVRVCVCLCVHSYLCLFVLLQDWQQGGKSEVYLWGNGRHGQLADAGTNLSVPTLAPSLCQTQQVHYSILLL